MDKYQLIDQIKTYLRLYENSKNEEYKQVQIIFNSLINNLNEKDYKKLLHILTTTSNLIGTPYGGHSQMYWNSFLQVINSLLTNTSF